ncbi:MAG: DUF4421 family protein [Bacteroidales bacterium]|nr:DUF4421 family protein [Bacteroidales bacterium]
MDSLYIGSYSRKISAGPIYNHKTYRFIIADRWGIGNPIEFQPNVNDRLGVRVQYQRFIINLHFPLPSNNYIFGNTKSTFLGISFQLPFKNWQHDFYYQNHRGFYIANADDIIPSYIAGKPFPKRGDLRTMEFGWTSMMVFSNQFSMKAAINQSEKQLRSKGSFVLGSSVLFHGFSADSAIIPKERAKFFQDIDALAKGRFLTFTIGPGYAYTYVFQDFFVTGMILINGGFQFQGYRNDGFFGKTKFGFRLNSSLNYRIAGGFNLEKFYGGLVYDFQNQHIKIEDSKITTRLEGVNLNCGFRF